MSKERIGVWIRWAGSLLLLLSIAAIGSITSYLHGQDEKLDAHDKRLVKLETRLEAIPRIERKLDKLLEY